MGDAGEFAEFARGRHGALYRYAYLLAGERGLAEDLVQEGLVKTYVAWRRLRDPANAEAYTRRVITTTAITWWRRKSWNAERPNDDLPRATRAVRGHHRAGLALARAAATAAAPAGRDRAQVLRGPDRGADRRSPQLLRRHCEEPGLGRAEEAARPPRRRRQSSWTRRESPDDRAAQGHPHLPGRRRRTAGARPRRRHRPGRAPHPSSPGRHPPRYGVRRARRGRGRADRGPARPVRPPAGGQGTHSHSPSSARPTR